MRLGIVSCAAILAAWLAIAAESTGTTEHIVFGEPAIYDRHAEWVGEEAGMWCANPSDADELIGITNTFVAHTGIEKNPRWTVMHDVVKHSADGGRSWQQVFITGGVAGLVDGAVGGAPHEEDPACTFGDGNVAFIGTMANYYDQLHERNGFTRDSHVYTVWRSQDGGRSWNDGTPLRLPGFFDRAHLRVDREPARYRGRLYVVGSTMSMRTDVKSYPGAIVVFRSDDQGRSFEGPVKVATGVGTGDGVIHMGSIAILPGGALAVSWTEGEIFGLRGMFDDTRGVRNPLPGPTFIKFSISHDGGASFATPVTVARARWNTVAAGRIADFGKWYPALAADSSSRAIYMAWSNARAAGQDIEFAKSSDQGATWSQPRIVSGSGRDHYAAMVTLAVNDAGVIGALYYSQERIGPKAQVWPMLTASVDGGATWLQPQRVGKHAVERAAVDERYKSTDWPGSKLRGEELGPVPTCNFGLIADRNGIFRVFTVAHEERRVVITAVTASVR